MKSRYHADDIFPMFPFTLIESADSRTSRGHSCMFARLWAEV